MDDVGEAVDWSAFDRSAGDAELGDERAREREALAAVDPDESVRHWMRFAREALALEGVTEVCVNRPGELWVERAGAWSREPGPDIETLERAGTAIARRGGRDELFGEGLSPLLGGTLPDEERVQLVVPPACEAGTIALSIRRPVGRHVAWSEYRERAAEVFAIDEAAARDTVAERITDGDVLGAIDEAMAQRKTILVAGATTAGKTTFLNALAGEVDPTERIVTIEDEREAKLERHANRVHLLHSGAKGRHPASDMLRVSLRLRPSRILLAEVRGPEAFDLLDVAAAGHGGTLTTCHAGTAALALDRVATMAMQDERGRAMGVEAVRRLVSDVIDMVIHIRRDGVWPRVTGLLYHRTDRAGPEAVMHHPPGRVR